MGRPKAELTFGTETVLERMIRIVSEVAAPIVVVGQMAQKRPRLPESVCFATDEQLHQGPLAGLMAGMDLLDGQVDAAFVTGCDIPLLSPEVIRLLIERMETDSGTAEIFAVHEEGFWQPLLAVYRCSVGGQARVLFDAGERSLQQLLKSCRTKEVDSTLLRSVDPDLHCLKGMNDQAAYQQLLALAGMINSTPAATESRVQDQSLQDQSLTEE